jgi:nicotinamide riboside kinase
VRGGLALRVVVLGAESTGTTTLAQDLAQYWRARGGGHGSTRWVPEYGRDYSVEKYARARAMAQLDGTRPPELAELVWESAEFEHIAAMQLVREDAAAATGGPILICDTDAFATTVWHERYVGGGNAAIERIADSRSHPLYLLTHSEGVPYEQDGLRDGAHIRDWMTERFIERLAETGRRSVILRGDRKKRLRDAVAAVEDAFQRTALTPPLPVRSF